MGLASLNDQRGLKARDYIVHETFAKERVPALDEPFKREVLQLLLEDARPSQGLLNGGADFFRLARIGQNAEPSIEHGFAACIGFAGDNRYPAGHRFEIDDDESFAAARHHESIGETVV